MKDRYQLYVVNKIKKIREQQGYSQARLATLLGISYGQMGNIESIRTPHKYTLSQIYQISIIFKVPIEQLFMEDQEEVSPPNYNYIISKIIQYEGR